MDFCTNDKQPKGPHTEDTVAPSHTGGGGCVTRVSPARWRECGTGGGLFLGGED